ncbi:MAG: hypothetical protein R6X20_09955 [Phycisphaerae bacterium]
MAETQETGKREFAARTVLRTACRHYVLFGLGTSLFAIAALFAIPWLPQCEKEYTGTAKFQRHQEATLEDRGGAFEGFKSILLHQLAGRDAVKQVIEDLHLDKGLPRASDGTRTPEGQQKLQAMVERFREQLKIAWDVKSDQVDLVSVSFTHADPKLAEEVPNRLVKNYITRVSEDIVERLKRSCDFLRQRVSEVETRLDQATREQIQFQKENAGALPESPGGLEERSRQVSNNIDTLRLQQRVAKQKLERLKAMAEKVEANPDEPVEVVKGPNPEIQRLKEERDAREQSLQEYEDALQDYRIVRRMKDEHPQVKAITAKIAAAEEKVAEIKKQIEETDEEVVVQRVFSSERAREDLAIALAAAESEYEMADKELERLQRQLKDYETYLARYAPIREEWVRISQRHRDLTQEKESWEQRLRDVEMSLAAEVAKRRNRLEQVQLAEEQRKPSSPKLHYLLGFALVGGLAFGGALVFLANLTDRSVWTPQDAEKVFGVPVCGTIGEIIPPRTRFWRGIQRFAIEPGVALLLLAAVGIGCMHVTLWLQYPERFEQWTTDQVGFLADAIDFAWTRAQAEVNGGL